MTQRKSSKSTKQQTEDIPQLPNYDLSDRDQEKLVQEKIDQVRKGISQDLEPHKPTGPELTGGDIDADWQAAESVGDEAVGGHAPTPDQSVVDELGHAIGFDEKEGELHTLEERVARRDHNRWELDRRSADTEPSI
jgi:hypothetical protein